jgi:hypothetical protein
MTTGLASLIPHAVTIVTSQIPAIKPASIFFNFIVSFLALLAKVVSVALEAPVVNVVFPFWLCTFLASWFLHVVSTLAFSL